MSPDGMHFVSGSGDFTILFNKIPKIIRENKINTVRTVKCVSMCKDGMQFVSGSDDWILRLWELSSGLQVRQ